MNIKSTSYQYGFTVLELAIVLIISGLMLTLLLGTYRIYTNNEAYHTTRDHLKRIDGALNTYRGEFGEYPCPSDPTLSPDHYRYGMALKECNVCIDNTTRPLLDSDNPAAGLSNVLCIETARDADEDGENDFILIGGLPFRTLAELQFDEDGFREYMGIDGYGNQFTYAVSANMADTGYSSNNPVSRSLGAITMVDENHADLSDPPSSTLFVVISHGRNAMGAYTMEGNRIDGNECLLTSMGPAIPPGLSSFGATTGISPEKENCDNNDPFFVKALRSLSEGDMYFDDIVHYRNTFSQTMWEITIEDIAGTRHEYLYNTNIGDVGVNNTDPTAKLHVMGDTKVDNNATAHDGFCDNLADPDRDCMDPDLFTAYDDTGERWQCGPGRVAIGIQNNALICEDLIQSPPDINIDCRNFGGSGIDYNVTGITYDRENDVIYASGCAPPPS